MRCILIVFGLSVSFLFSCGNQEVKTIDLSGEWRFKIDATNVGISDNWFNTQFTETILLPGSMTENDKGDAIRIETQWTGEILDSSWYFDEKYARYREQGNLKIPFWLQPEKHYVGAAWYQKDIEIPPEWEQKHIELFLERPHWETRIWIDDELVEMQNTLGTPHAYDLTNHISRGKHTITMRVDNRVKEIKPGESSHSITDNTQTNWNGIVGNIHISATPKVYIENVKIYPNITNKTVTVVVNIANDSGIDQNTELTLFATPKTESGLALDKISKNIKINTQKQIKVIYPMGENPLLWDEYDPNLYTMDFRLTSDVGEDSKQIVFGMREFKPRGKQFAINGKPIFLRGTLECAIFPKTGYPSTDVRDWKRIFKICRDHGLNHMRFHSWCPPEVAFEAADELGFYLQVEASSWTNDKDAQIGNGDPIDGWIYKEATSILETYGNHPSFCMMAYGNEPGGKKQKEYLSRFVAYFKKMDSTKVYTGGAGWPFIENADFYNNAKPRIQGWGQGLKSIINNTPPQTVFDYSDVIQKTTMPYVSHEIGQWCVYPNFKEIPKYTGVLKPKNFEIFQETLEENHMGNLADSLLLASGKLQVLGYKADIEAALRTKDFAGFQLLDLHDFPGQGTALVGVLDAFWDEKGYITPEEYRSFCSETVPLARLEKRVFLNTDTLKVTTEVAHYGEKDLHNVTPIWKLTDKDGYIIDKGSFTQRDIPRGNGISLGNIHVALDRIKTPKKLILELQVAENINSWDLWVYPKVKSENSSLKEIKVINSLNSESIDYLKNGGNMLLTAIKGTVKPEKGGAIGVGFSSIFWNTAYTSGQKPHTMGILCNPNHPALKYFPTEYHSNWQWWDAMSNANAIILDEFTPDLKPIVRVIDDWFQNRRTALIFEAKVGKGKLLVSGIDLTTNLEHRIEAQQLLYSLEKYMTSSEFNPDIEMKVEDIKNLFV